jgi:hypothetical protein
VARRKRENRRRRRRNRHLRRLWKNWNAGTRPFYSRKKRASKKTYLISKSINESHISLTAPCRFNLTMFNGETQTSEIITFIKPATEEEEGNDEATDPEAEQGEPKETKPALVGHKQRCIDLHPTSRAIVSRQRTCS